MSPPHATTVRFDDLPPVSTEVKRGISIPSNFDPRHFALYKEAIDAGKISWLFNWEMRKPNGLPPNIIYVPQCRTVKAVATVIPRMKRYLHDDQTQHFMYIPLPPLNPHSLVVREIFGKLILITMQMFQRTLHNHPSQHLR